MSSAIITNMYKVSLPLSKAKPSTAPFYQLNNIGNFLFFLTGDSFFSYSIICINR